MYREGKGRYTQEGEKGRITVRMYGKAIRKDIVKYKKVL